MEQDTSIQLKKLKVDGGAVKNNLLMQFQSDMLGVPVERPVVNETTALGAAYLAGLAVGFWEDRRQVTEHYSIDRIFEPQMEAARREHLYNGWKQAVKATQAFHE
jgi:glycerol kinase